GAESKAGIENADDTADVAAAEITHDQRREQRDEAAVEHAIGEGEGGERPESRRGRPDREGESHADEHREQREAAAEPVGEPAEKEAPRRAADADDAEQQHGGGLRDAVVEGVGHEMDEGHEEPE